MRRSVWLGWLTLLGVCLTVATYQASQARPEIHGVREVAANLYMLGNDPAIPGMQTGGNTAVFVTAVGVTLVDTKLEGYGRDILDLVASITDNPVTTIINTHTHYDHSGSNTEFPETVDFVVHENTLAQMSRSICEPVTNCSAFKGDHSSYLPRITYSQRTSLFSGDDQIDLYHFGRGHTDGDTFVVFKAARTMHTGDMFQRKGLPFIDVANGNGSAVEFGSTLKKAVAGIEDVDTVIPGHHTEPVTWADFVNFSDFFNDLVGKAQRGIANGQSAQEVADAYAKPVRFNDFQAPPQTVRTIVDHVYNEQ
jgi:glyoxylase-like metal-dependent hydrolase (beta-lactamase superfamily II)